MQEAQVYSHHGPTPEKVVFVRAPFDFKRDVSVPLPLLRVHRRTALFNRSRCVTNDHVRMHQDNRFEAQLCVCGLQLAQIGCSKRCLGWSRTVALKIHAVAPKIHTVALKIHTVSPKIHAVALKIHTVAPKIHAVALKIHTVAPKIHAVALKIHTVASKIHTVAPKIHTVAPKIHAGWPRTCSAGCG
eukprot:772717-Prorocentrum_minimum.AAC.2